MMNLTETNFLCGVLDADPEAVLARSYHNTVYSVLYGLFGCLSIAGNFLNIVVILTSRTLRGPTGAMLINMSAADLGIGVMLLSFTVPSSYKNCWPYEENIIQVYGYLNNIFFCESIYMLACIAVDRYISVVHSLHYTQTVTFKRVLVVIAVSWALTMVNFALPFTVQDGFSYKNKRFDAYINFQASLPLAIYLVLSGFGVSLVAIFYCYSRICVVGLKARREILPASQNSNGLHGGHLKFAFALMSVSIVFFINFTPMFFLEFLGGYVVDEKTIPQWIYIVVSLFNYFNCFCDCIVYNVTYRPFREATKNLFSVCCRRSAQNQNVVTVFYMSSQTPTSSTT